MANQHVSLENLYEISLIKGYFHDNSGGIYSNLRGGLKKLSLIPHGGKTKKTYYRVKVKGRLWMVHHLVLIEKEGRFLLNGESGNHINGNTEDNCRENLEISTHAEQVAHAVQNKLYASGNAWRKARGLPEG